jgi:hypothetical protein
MVSLNDPNSGATFLVILNFGSGFKAAQCGPDVCLSNCDATGKHEPTPGCLQCFDMRQLCVEKTPQTALCNAA